MSVTIDVHCHVFNADAVEIASFLKVLGSYRKGDEVTGRTTERHE